MPQLPGYDSQKNITPGIAEPIRQEAAQPFQDIQKVAGTMQNIAQKWSDAHDVMQYTDAKAKYETAVADIQSRAAADPDFYNSDSYIKELDKAKENSMAGIGNQQVAGKLGLELDYGNQITAIKINSEFRKKQIAFNKVQVGTNLDALQQKKLNAVSPSEATEYDQQIKELIAVNVASGVLSYEEADKLLKESQETSVKYEIYNDPATQEKDSTVLSELRDQKNPKYSHLDPKTRLKMIEESQRRIFQNNQTFKRENEISKDARFQNIFQKANEGTLTLADLDVEMDAAENKVPGAMDQKEILSIRKSLQTRIKTDLETMKDNGKAMNYLNFVDNFIDDETDRQKGREAIVNAFKDNILSSKEAGFLNSLKREAEEIKWDRQVKPNNLIPFKNAITAIGSWFRGKENSSEQEAAMAIKQLLNGAADGEDIEELVPKILNADRVNTKPDIKNFPADGQLMIDPVTGVKAIVYPDGKIEAVK